MKIRQNTPAALERSKARTAPLAGIMCESNKPKVNILDIAPSADVKMVFPVKRKPTTSRHEFVAYWFAHHMPFTIAAMAGRGRGYIGTVFKGAPDNGGGWDGFAQMFLADPLRHPPEGFGARPVDSFQERVEPYFGWATREYVVESGADHLFVRPLTLGLPFPTSRSGFFKVVVFVPPQADADHGSFQSRWLTERAPRIADALRQVDGFRYVVSLSLEPETAPYSGMEELYFHDESAWRRFQALIGADDMAWWGAGEGPQTFFSDTEFVAIPV